MSLASTYLRVANLPRGRGSAPARQALLWIPVSAEGPPRHRDSPVTLIMARDFPDDLWLTGIRQSMVK
jgi:hypothetical protein